MSDQQPLETGGLKTGELTTGGLVTTEIFAHQTKPPTPNEIIRPQERQPIRVDEVERIAAMICARMLTDPSRLVQDHRHRPQVAISNAPRGSVRAPAVLHPFRVKKRVTPESDPVTYDRIVYGNSQLLTSLAPIDIISPSGLAVDDESPTDAGWKLFIANDLIWLEATVDGGVIEYAAIKSYGAGDDWPVFDYGAGSAQCAVEWTGTGTSGDPFVQTIARAVIARSFVDANSVPQIVQVAYSDFIAVDYDIDGKIMKVLQPFAGGL